MKAIVRGLAISLLIIGAVFVVSAQEKLRRVEQPAKFTYPNTPIQVVVNIDGKEMTNREARTGADWLKRISLDVTNTSGKDIDLVWINLMIKEPVYGASVSSPETAGIVITVELRPTDTKVLPNGARVTLRPPVAMVEYWTRYARQQGFEDIERLILDIKMVKFTDDMSWERGSMTHKDAGSGTYIIDTLYPKFLDLFSVAKMDVNSVSKVFFRCRIRCLCRGYRSRGMCLEDICHT